MANGKRLLLAAVGRKSILDLTTHTHTLPSATMNLLYYSERGGGGRLYTPYHCRPSPRGILVFF